MTTTAGSAQDEIRLQVIWNRLLSIVEEQAQTLLRTAFSAPVREAGDLAAGVFDPQGRMLAQAVTGTPGHVNTMAEAVGHFLARFPVATMRPGDQFITNDPYLASGHLHDITIVAPAFHRDRVVALISCCCHQVDIGGLGQGPDGRSIYEEGLQIPVMRLVKAGAINDELLEMIAQNVRTPFEVRGDVLSSITANEAATHRLAATLAEFGLVDLAATGAAILERSRRAVTAAIGALPRGTWRHGLTIDGYDAPIELRAALTIGADAIEVDYAGSAPPSPYGINVVLNYCAAYTAFALKCAVAPEVPNNAGSLAPFRITAPEPCILNARRPWPVAARHVVGLMLPDLVYGCLDQALPGRVPAEGASCNWTAQVRRAPGQASDHAPPFDVVFFNSGGSGARPARDGLSATAFPSGVRAMPVEVTEQASPVVIWRKELRPDSGGAGKQRGGLGLSVEVGVRDDAPFALLAMFERLDHPPLGRAGGGAGAAGKVALDDDARLRGKGLQTIPAGARLILETPGGAGHGAARARPPELVARDVRLGLVTRETAARDYGVVIGADGGIDAAATAARRAT